MRDDLDIAPTSSTADVAEIVSSCERIAIEIAGPLADKIDLRHTKKILRASQRGRVPDDVLTRPKQGFGVPVRAWLAGPARRLLEELTTPDVLAARGLFEARAVAALKADFYAGRAVVESRSGRLFEIGPGSNLPGLGRVETIKRQDGHVVVVTRNGIISASLEPRRPPYYLPYRY